VQTLTFKTLYVLVFLAHGRRELMHVNTTANPTAAWVCGQVIEATPWGQKPPHLLHDHDAVYGRDFRQLETPVQVVRAVDGSVRSRPVLGGLHHVYERAA
jgi:hypothetical protein